KIFYEMAKKNPTMRDPMTRQYVFLTVLSPSRGDFKRVTEIVNNGDAILIWPGVYNEAIIMPDRAITVQGATDPPVINSGSSLVAFGFYDQQGPDTILRNLIITGSKYAIESQYSQPTLTNLTLAGNESGLVIRDLPVPWVTNSIIWANSNFDVWCQFGCSLDYSCVPSNVQGTGSISQDPLFVNAEIGDYHLQSIGGRYSPQLGDWTSDFQHSSCIDAGQAASSSENEAIPHGSRINIGAYGGTPYASKASEGFSADSRTGILAPWLKNVIFTIPELELDFIEELNSNIEEGVLKSGRGDIIGL
ncbi:MAG: hypothetical protein MI702_08220, partial [Chlorobiales bacterium]|nr:hypothetical protein [Chlorobiales bacterium]